MLIFVLSFLDETSNERTFGPLIIRPPGHVITWGTSTQEGDATSQKNRPEPTRATGLQNQSGGSGQQDALSSNGDRTADHLQIAYIGG